MFTIPADRLRRMTFAEIWDALECPTWVRNVPADEDHVETTRALDGSANAEV